MLEDTYAHSPITKIFDNKDVYGVGYDEQRASRKNIRLGIIGAGGVAVSKHIPAITRLRAIWEPVELVAISRRNERAGKQIQAMEGRIDVPEALQLLSNGPVKSDATLHSWVFDPRNLTAYVAVAGNNPPVTATDRTFTKIDLRAWLGQE